jgi:hypothetical protein
VVQLSSHTYTCTDQKVLPVGINSHMVCCAKHPSLLDLSSSQHTSGKGHNNTSLLLGARPLHCSTASATYIQHTRHRHTQHQNCFTSSHNSHNTPEPPHKTRPSGSSRYHCGLLAAAHPDGVTCHQQTTLCTWEGGPRMCMWRTSCRPRHHTKVPAGWS